MSTRTQLQIAVIGAGPSGIHTAETAICHGMRDVADVRVDLIDSRPTAAGLVRAHSPIEGSVDALDRLDEEQISPHLRLIGNVTVGTDIPAVLLTGYYDAVISTVGLLDGALQSPGHLDLRSLGPGSTDGSDLVDDLRDAGLAVTTWHGWYRLDDSVRRGQRGWERAVAQAHAVPEMP
ncbi:hypothetical protein [Corynebacterium guangdongense]|uniref:Ferredoxin--NADP+ reductase n=1 Tax=Corynebacterium guangdongense TaxID=1783348 RepID=A0ABU1ZZM2_9CORY|nr:hypothetical protein [Corynebacterium guangdongense]MDR7330398.1 ferredoxin--NADP+ reductase [Corynebacterium guangdongense]WJZ18956.1 NADPH-ferredoxin reductase FprA [Corynebacterium guangdongense]